MRRWSFPRRRRRIFRRRRHVTRRRGYRRGLNANVTYNKLPGRNFYYIQRDSVAVPKYWYIGMGEEDTNLKQIELKDIMGAPGPALKAYLGMYNKVNVKKIMVKVKQLNIDAYTLVLKVKPSNVTPDQQVKNFVKELKKGGSAREVAFSAGVKQELPDCNIYEDLFTGKGKHLEYYFDVTSDVNFKGGISTVAANEGVRRMPVDRVNRKYFRFYPGCKKFGDSAGLAACTSGALVDAWMNSNCGTSESFKSKHFACGPHMQVAGTKDDKSVMYRIDSYFTMDVYTVYHMCGRKVNLAL